MIDVVLGVAVMGTVGVLIGILLGGSFLYFAAGLGVIWGPGSVSLADAGFFSVFLSARFLGARWPGPFPDRKILRSARGPARRWADFWGFGSPC